jgi:hypothetical protein
MALPATVQWDVRSGGNSANGGGFNPGATTPGTDYSLQNSAQIAYTDLVIGGTTTQLTSAGNPFTSAHVGNLINITGGTGFTTGRYHINSVSAGTATMDRAVGTAASTGGTGNLGGSLALPTNPTSLVSGQIIWIQGNGATYTLTATTSASVGVSYIGYKTTHGDNPTGSDMPTITTATSSIHLLTGPVVTQAFAAMNLTLTTTASVKAEAIHVGAASNLFIKNVVIGAGFTNGMNLSGTFAVVEDCQIISSSINGIFTTAVLLVKNTLIWGVTGSGAGNAGINTNGGFLFVHNSIVGKGSKIGINIQNPASWLQVCNSTIAGNSSDGVLSAPAGGIPCLIESSIVYGNGGWGLNITPSTTNPPILFVRNNAYGSNTSGNYQSGVGAGAGDVTLSATPFTSSSTGDYSLNSTAGGGAACKAVGYPGVFPGGLSTGHLDIGAVQSSAAGGGASSNYGWVS